MDPTLLTIIIGWLTVLSVVCFFVKRGPAGPKGEKGEASHYIGVWNIREPSIELLDDPEYLQKLICNINKYQIKSGSNVGQ